ncbi:MAG: RNA polymerase sigma-70 factor [Bacteroidales bacterium]
MEQEFDDKTLLKRIQSGDEVAFEMLFNRYWESLFAAAMHRLQSKDLSEDVLQELFVDLWEKRDDLKIRTNIQGYLFTALKNRVLNKIKTESVREKYEQMVIEFYELNELATEHTFTLKILREELEKETEKLPDRCREVFELSRTHQLSHKEIGKKLNISTKTVENHIRLALKKLRPKLENIIYLLIVLFW